MSSSSVLVLVLVLMVVVPLVLGSELVVNPVVPLEGDAFLLECGGSGTMKYFLLHQKGDALGVGRHQELQIQVFANATVFFESVSLTHEGTHLCLRSISSISSSSSSDTSYKGYPAPMRVRPLPPDDLWAEVYETKFVTGFLAALVIAAMFALGCLVYKYRWQPKRTGTRPILTYDNPIMASVDDAESNCSTKM